MIKIFLITLIITLTSLTGFAQKTVNEFFLAIPEEYIKAEVRQRAMWIDDIDEENEFLEFTIPAAQFLDEYIEDANVFGNAQLFHHDDGSVIVGLSINICAEKKCEGQLLLLKFENEEWEDVTADLAPNIDNDDIYEVLKDSPAIKKAVKKGEDIPLAIQFYGGEKIINYLAECEKSFDGGVVAKMFKWNGTAFEEFEYGISP